MKLISWNVNGIRAVLNKGFMDFFNDVDADIFCIQETKADPSQVTLDLPGYRQYWHSAEKKGYSGTAVFTKVEPLKVTKDMKGHSGEGRILNLEFDDFVLVNVYTVNAQRGLTRLDYRMQWDRDFLKHLKSFGKPVVVCGDLNVAHKEIDLKHPKSNVKNAGFTPEERAGFQTFIDAGFIDAFREFNQEPDQYTWWSYMMNSRAKNVGWRIDYFLISKSLRPKLKEAFILPDVMGSDHCPVGVKID